MLKARILGVLGTKGLNDRSYNVRSDNGATYRRNRFHLRPEVEPENLEMEDPERQMPGAPEPEAPIDETRPRRERHAPAWMKDYVPN